MGKYLNLEQDVFQIIEQKLKTEQDLKVYPSNYLALNSGNKFLRCSIIPSGKGINLNSVSGLLIIDIFTPVGVGPRDATLIADILDQELAGKSINSVNNNVTQFMGSTFVHVGVDSANPSLFRSNYTVPFNFFGV